MIKVEAKIKGTKNSTKKQKNYAYDLLDRVNEAYEKLSETGCTDYAEKKVAFKNSQIAELGGGAVAVIETLKDIDANRIFDVAAQYYRRKMKDSETADKLQALCKY